MSTRRPATPPATSAARDADSPGRRRIRRPREETRRILLDAATRLVISRLAEDGEFGNPLSAVRISDVLEALNGEGLAEGRVPMTTGAVYQIWPSQVEFQSDLLDHVMNVVATLGMEEFRGFVRQQIAESVSFSQLLVAMAAYGQDDIGNQHEISLSVGLAALVAPDRIRASEAEANAVYVAQLGEVLAEVLAYGGREMRPGLTIADLVWVIEAFAAGTEVRARTHPEVVARMDATGRHAFSLAQDGIIEALTVPHASLRDRPAAKP